MSAFNIIALNISIGSLRLFSVLGLFLCVYLHGRKTNQNTAKGWNWLLSGFALLFFSSVLNIFSLPTGSIAIANLSGIICLIIGFHSWLPSVAKTNDPQIYAKLLETQQRYRDLADLSPDGILLHRMGKIIYANTAIAKMLEIASPDDMIGRRNLDFIHSAYKEQTYERIRALNHDTDKVPLIHLKLVKATGESLDVEVAASITNFGGKRVVHSVIRDVSDRVKTEATLKQSESDLRAIFNSMAEFYYRIDLQGHIVRASDAAQDITGYGAKEIIGYNLADCYADSNNHERFLKTLHKAGGHLRNYEAQWIKSNHEHIWVSTNARHYLAADGTIIGIEGTVRDITDTVQARDVLRHMAMHDVLTGLGNRRSFEARLKEALPRARRAKIDGAILYFDLDAFKPVNDTYGHDLGDDVLREVARRIMELARETDFSARIGGDEFCLILEGVGNNEATMQVAQKLIASISAPYHMRNLDITIGVSIGIMPFNGNEDETCIHAFITAADTAMYTAKTSGGNTFRFAASPSRN